MAHAQKPDFVFRRNGRVHLNRQGRQFSRLLAAEVCASAVVMLDTPSSEVVWRVLATYSIRQFPLHFPSRSSPCAMTFQLDSTLRRLSGLFAELHLLVTKPLFLECQVHFLTLCEYIAWRSLDTYLLFSPSSTSYPLAVPYLNWADVRP